MPGIYFPGADVAGGETVNQYSATIGAVANGQSGKAFYAAVEFRNTLPTALTLLINSKGGKGGILRITGVGALRIALDTATGGAQQDFSGAQLNTIYHVFAKHDVANNVIRIFVNGTQVGSDYDATGQDIGNAVGSLLFYGRSLDSEDVVYHGFADWVDSFPSDANIASHAAGSLALADFDTPPSASLGQKSGNGSYVSTFAFDTGGYSLSYVAGQTSGDNFVYAEASAAVGIDFQALTTPDGVWTGEHWSPPNTRLDNTPIPMQLLKADRSPITNSPESLNTNASGVLPNTPLEGVAAGETGIARFLYGGKPVEFTVTFSNL